VRRSEEVEAAARAFLSIQYAEGQGAHESRIAPGLVVVSGAGIALAEEVNYWKGRLAAVLKAMEGREEIGVVDRQTGARGRRPLREVALEAFYFRRLHYFQAVRKIIVLREDGKREREARGSEERERETERAERAERAEGAERRSEEEIGTPEYVSFSWASCRAVRRTSREALIEELGRRRLVSGKGASRLIERDLAILRRLPAGEPLALVREAPATVKANVAWPARGGRPATRRVCSAVAPLVMLGTALPERFRPLPQRAPERSVRQSRRDTELESKALLSTLPVFRYLKRHRSEKRGEAG